MEEDRLKELINELTAKDIDAEYLGRVLVNYISKKEGSNKSNDILCEVVVSISALLPQDDIRWIASYINGFIERSN